MASLSDEAARFRQWAQTLAGHYGEWECDYPDWDALYRAARRALDDGSWRENLDDLVYVLARDNESEIIRDELEERPELLRELAPFIVERGEPDARWQLAQSLGATDWGAELLAVLAEDPDEYVRRRALLAMAAAKLRAKT